MKHRPQYIPVSNAQMNRLHRARRTAWQARRIEDLVCRFVVITVVLTIMVGPGDEALEIVVRLWLGMAWVYGLAAVHHGRSLARLRRMADSLGVEVPDVS